MDMLHAGIQDLGTCSSVGVAISASCMLLRCRYEEFKAALEGLDPKRQAASPLPIIHQWREPMGGPGTKCAPAQPAGVSACLAT